MMDDDDSWWTDPLPERLLTLLERDLLAVDIDTFWDRKDALERMLPERDSTPEQLRAARERAAAVVPADLLAAFIEAIDAPDGPAFTLDERLGDWESLRVDHEKLVGHLLLVHDEPVPTLRAMSYLDLEEHHRLLHERAVQGRAVQ
ncbi:MAG TPA: hypothetical protein VNU01_12165 [Egibacteraceae bacterium]|nr:hypothetical protein [Egibacteraceae bacterium]